MVDLYIQNIFESGYDDTKIEENDILNLFKQQLNMLFNTRENDVLGCDKFGLNLEDLIFELNISIPELKNIINYYINTYCTLSAYINYTLDINLYTDGVKDFVVIDIYVLNKKIGQYIL